MKVAYFVNQYPAITHTFIRREINALESLGVYVQRYSLRANAEDLKDLVDPEDIAEMQRTYCLFETPIIKIVFIFMSTLFSRPIKVVGTLLLAVRLGWRSDRGIFRHLAYVVEAALLTKLCNKANIRHIHAHFGTNSATISMFAMKLSKLTFSFTAHGADELDQASSTAMREKLKCATFVVGASWFVRSQLLRQLPFDAWHKIKVVHCGLASDFMEYPMPKPTSHPRLICVGRLCDEKAQILLVHAAKSLKKRGVEFELVFAGDGPLRSYIEKEIANAGLGDQIRITGWISTEQIKHELLAARALVLPSLIEGLPVAIMESMALGRPAISTFVAGIPELVVTNETGWLVPAGDIEALEEAMISVLAMSNANLEIIGRAAQLRVRRSHNSTTEAGKLKVLFEKAIG